MHLLRGDLHNNLPSMFSLAKILESLHRVLKREHTVDMGPQLVRIDKAKHIRMKLLGPDVYSTEKVQNISLPANTVARNVPVGVPNREVLHEQRHQHIGSRFRHVSQEANAMDVATIRGTVKASPDLLRAYVVENVMSADALREL